MTASLSQTVCVAELLYLFGLFKVMGMWKEYCFGVPSLGPSFALGAFVSSRWHATDASRYARLGYTMLRVGIDKASQPSSYVVVAMIAAPKDF